MRREILIAISIKLALLAVMYGLFFGSPHRPPSSPAAIATALLGAGAQ